MYLYIKNILKNNFNHTFKYTFKNSKHQIFEKDTQNCGFSHLFFPAFPNSNSPMANHLMLNRWM